MKLKNLTALILTATAAFMTYSQSASQDEYDLSQGKVLLEFKNTKGDTYTILSTVEEAVYVQESPYSPLLLHHQATILNRVSAEVIDVLEDGSAVNECTFMTSENSVSTSNGSVFEYGTEYESVFKRSPQGQYTITDEYFMPTVIDVPVFKKEAVEPGTKWTAEGFELHDLRNMNIPTPYKVPFDADYEYLGKKDGFDVIRVKYEMYMETPSIATIDSNNDYPVEISGWSDELIYFNSEIGQIDHYTESFRIVMNTNWGMSYDFRGTAHAEVKFTKPASEENVAEVQKEIEKLGIENVTVKKDEVGLTLSIENIQFKPDSAYLLESEKTKLKKIAKILEAYKDKDILVSGHTALAGSAESCQKLSELRAQAVASQLISMGVRDSKHIFTKGFGATKPIDSNKTPDGMAKNRRVEITLMDK
ncbi:OmpA family protein [Treponema sp.]|uniref:OmpA family protein n=1 Tax=Treponema sp. TaxID=166 RepID=UPI0025D471CB|nr:OmpA family protein [Treponema sp.]MCR5217598.1 OmpA family protein [Treponema sp.]